MTDEFRGLENDPKFIECAQFFRATHGVKPVDSSMQALPYPGGLPEAVPDATHSLGQLRAEIVAQQAEIERLRIENAQQRRKLFQKQQQIGRLHDHVNRLARVLGQLKYSAGKAENSE